MKLNKKVAFFFHDSDMLSGGTMALNDIIENIDSKSQIVCVFPTRHGSAIDFYREKKYIVLTSFYRQTRLPIKLKGIKKTIFVLKKYFEKFVSKIYLNFFTIPKIKSIHVEAVYNNTSFIDAGIYCAKRLNLFCISHVREFGEVDHKITPFYGRKKFYKIFNENNAIVFISNCLMENYKGKIKFPSTYMIYDDVSKKYILDIYNKAYFSNDEVNILLAGTITPGKGQLYVLQSLFSILKLYNIKIWIAGGIGDNDYYLQIQQFILKNQLENNVKYLGLVKDMNALRLKMDIAVISSDSEAFGRVIVEAMLAKMIIVSSDSGSSRELVNSSVGFIFDKNKDNLKEVIVYILNNKDEAILKASNSFKYASRFTKSNCAKQIVRILNESKK